MERKLDLGRERMGEAIKDIGATGIHIDEALLADVRKNLLEKGYDAAELFVSQSTASLERDELLRVLNICEHCRLTPELSAEVLENLSIIESDIW